MKKKVEFGMLKTGQKFRYKNKLYLMDDTYFAINIKTGENDCNVGYGALVTPVKVKITVQK